VAKRGFFAELQHQSQLAAKRKQQAAKLAQRNQAAAQRQAEQAQREAERARLQGQRAAAADQKAAAAEQKRLEQQAQQAHLAAMQAEAEAMNAELQSQYDEIDSLLTAALVVDSFVDLAAMRTVAGHPPFPRTDLEQPVPPPPPVMAPPEPHYVDPPAPKGLGALGSGKRHQAAIATAHAEFAQQHEAWQIAVGQVPTQQLQQMQAHQQAEQERQRQLDEARQTYELECQQREQAVSAENQELDQLIAGLEQGVGTAVHDYASIVLGRSQYPDHFPVVHDLEFDSTLRELALKATLPGPGEISETKEYKYNKAKDEIISTALTQKQVKDRYAGAVHAVALRTLHEIFHADRGGAIESVSLSLDTETIDPATGQVHRTALLAVAADRAAFTSFDLNNVVPEATLHHLNALISKNPHGLVPIDQSRGVRGA
jgi:restriction system protein